MDLTNDSIWRVGPGPGGILLLTLFSAPIAALVGFGVGLATSHLAGAPMAVPAWIAVALVALFVRVLTVTAVVGNGLVLVRNILSTHRLPLARVRRLSSGTFVGAGRPLPLIVLVADGDRRSHRVKVQATVSVNRDHRKRVADQFLRLAPAGEDFSYCRDY